MTAFENGFYVTGGTVPRGAPSYVRRKADDDLYEGLCRGEFCYVLTSRQMGKSSLMVRTATRLRDVGMNAIVLDLTAIGQNLNAGQWYEGLLSLIGQQLHIEDMLEDFWQEHPRLGPLQRWMLALHEIVLARDGRPIVIFIDEIDAVRSLPFSTDEFFAGIRELHNQRARNPELNRLTFCLLGVAAPSDLIRDTRVTPFNIGRRIELHDFTEVETAPLAQGLGREERLAWSLLKRVLYWTGGHPYLTQQLCRAIAEDRRVQDTHRVDRRCAELFLTPQARDSDDNLLFVRKRMLRNDEVDLVSTLELYALIRRGKRVRDDGNNPLINVLRLSGIVHQAGDHLAVRNRIYERVFNPEWIEKQMPDAELKRQRQAYRRGQLRTAGISAVIIALLVSAIFVTLAARNRAEKEKHNARRSLYIAQMNLAQQALKDNNIERVTELLEGQKPDQDEEDLRGFEWDYFDRLCHGDRHTFEAGAEVRAIAFSPDGQTLAAACDDVTLRLWSLSSPREIISFKGHTGLINAVIFLPDGKTLATAGDDNTVRIWDLAMGREQARLDAHTQAVHSVLFSPLNLSLISGSEDGVVHLWNAASRQRPAKFQATMDPIRSMALSPDGRTLALGSGLGVVEIWDVTKRQRMFQFSPNNNIAAVRTVAFSPDGKMLATGNENGAINLWDMAGKRNVAVLKEDEQPVLSLAFSPGGELLAAGSQNKTVTLWALDRQRPATVIQGHRGAIRSLAFSPDGKLLATGSQDRGVKLWDVDAPQNPMAFPSRRSVDGAALATARGTDSSGGKIHAIAFSPDGRRIAAGGDESARVFSISGRHEIARVGEEIGAITALAFAPDGKTLATASEDETLRLWDSGNGSEIRLILKDAGEFRALEFSPDGSILAGGGQAQTIWLWDAASGRELARLSGHNEALRAIAFSPDGGILAAGSSSGVKLWSVAQQRELARIKLPSVNCVAFSPDGRELALAGDDGTVRLWDWARNVERLSLKGHTDIVWSLAFSPDGRRLASGGKDKTLKLWEIVSGQELATFKDHGGDVIAVRFSPEGKILATGSHDGFVKLWTTASSTR